MIRCFVLGLLAIAVVVCPAFAVNDEAITAKRPPRLLSEFGFFQNMEVQTPSERVLPFSINTPLFSDFADKLRFAYIPDGKSAFYDDREAFLFPVGSALIKTFAYPKSGGSGLRLVETRVLLKKDSGWDAWAYLWNDDQTDAVRLVAGKKLQMTISTPTGEEVAFTYAVPNKNQCKGCHSVNGEISPIGPKARNLNGSFDYPDGTANQLERWLALGILEGAPDKASWSRAPDWLDEQAPLDERARAWLDVNCAHCHRREGPASNSGLFLTWHEDDPVALGINKRPVAAGRGSAGMEFSIVPGRPEASIMFYRVNSTEPGVMMPELGRSLADHRAVDLLRDWITSLR